MAAGGLRALPVPSPGDTKYRLREGALGGTRGLLPILGGHTRAGSSPRIISQRVRAVKGVPSPSLAPREPMA